MLALLNVGPQEMIILLVVGLLIFGRRLPEVGRSIGKTLLEFRRGLQSFKDEMDRNDDLRDSRRSLDDLRHDMSRQVNAYWADQATSPAAGSTGSDSSPATSEIPDVTDPGAPTTSSETLPPLTVTDATEAPAEDDVDPETSSEDHDERRTDDRTL